MEANSTGGQGSRRAVEPGGGGGGPFQNTKHPDVSCPRHEGIRVSGSTLPPGRIAPDALPMA